METLERDRDYYLVLPNFEFIALYISTEFVLYGWSFTEATAKFPITMRNGAGFARSFNQAEFEFERARFTLRLCGASTL